MKKQFTTFNGSKKLNLQMFAAAADGQKTKLQKHLEELGEQTSGNSHDAVTFSGKGLSLLDRMLAPLRKKAKVEDDDDDMDDDYDDDDEDDVEDKNGNKKVKKNANGGEVEDEDEDMDDPAVDDEDIIANKGKRIPKDELGAAVKKNARNFDERRFVKSMKEHEEVLDATPALTDLVKSMRSLGKSVNGTNEMLEAVQEQNIVLAQAVKQLLKSNAALAADLELVKKQPVNQPSSGFVVLNKGEVEGGSGRRLSKSDIQDSLTDLMNEGEIDPDVVSRLRYVNGDAQLRTFVDQLPASVRKKL